MKFHLKDIALLATTLLALQPTVTGLTSPFNPGNGSVIGAIYGRAGPPGRKGGKEDGNRGSPGRGEGVGEVKPFSEFNQKGNERRTDHENAVSSNRAETRIVARPEEYVEREAYVYWRNNPEYSNNMARYTIPTDNHPELEVFKAEHLEDFDPARLDTDAIELTIRSKDDQVILQSTYGKDGDFILAQEAFKANDPTVDPRMSVPINEIWWQAFRDFVSDKAASLHVIFLMDITNKGFWSVTEKAYDQYDKAFSEVVVWKRDDIENFDAFIGTDNINGKVIAMMNHHLQAGDKQIRQIVTAPRHVEGSDGKMTVALVVGPKP
jgi:hypothetical protein